MRRNVHVVISVDMEGVAGVVDPDDISPGHAEYERNRGYLTDEASAAVRGVLAADAGASVVVCDAHARFRNLLPDRLDPRCTLVRGLPRQHAMMTGLDASTDAVCFVGYHGRAGTARSVLAHTISGATIAEVRCNGTALGEFGLNAALALHYGALPVLATGDDTLVGEARSTVPGIATVEVKRALGNRAAESLHPSEACRRIEAGALAGVQAALRSPAGSTGQRPDGLAFDGPVELEVDLHRPVMTELACSIPGVELRGPLTLGFRAADFPAAYDLIEVFTVLAAHS